VTIVEAADDETATAGLIRLASQGNLRTTSMHRRGARSGREESLVEPPRR
jgi:uncharacterized protein with GYD domain